MKCEAKIWHGPGHQSRTACKVQGPHTVHETRYGRYEQEARWVGGDVHSGFFDEPPKDPDESEGRDA